MTGRNNNVEQLVLRSILTLGALPDPERRWIYFTNTGAWPDQLIEFADRIGVESDDMRERFEPTRADIDNMHSGMALLAWLKRQNNGKRNIRVVWRRAYGLPWWKIAGKAGRSERQVRRWYDDAIEAMWIKHVDLAPEMSDINGYSIENR